MFTTQIKPHPDGSGSVDFTIRFNHKVIKVVSLNMEFTPQELASLNLEETPWNTDANTLKVTAFAHQLGHFPVCKVFQDKRGHTSLKQPQDLWLLERALKYEFKKDMLGDFTVTIISIQPDDPKPDSPTTP